MTPVPTRVFSGERFRQLRKEAGIKGSDIRRATGIHETTLSAWVTGKWKPSVELLATVADFIGCDINDFLVVNEEASDVA